MRNEHLRPLLDNDADSSRFFEVSQAFAQAKIPDEIVSALRVGQLTALEKPNGGVRRTVVGDVIRRLVAKTMSQQFMARFEDATKPFQYALSTRAWCESIAHVVQALTDNNAATTVLSIDGVGAFDLISRRAMMEALHKMPDGDVILPFVLQFYGRPSTHLWEDEEGVVREIQQGEGGKQGDPLMPALFALGQHQALVAVQETLQPSERLLAFLDDVYVASVPARIATVEESLEDKLWRHARISINQVKTQVWNRSGETPPACEHLFFDANGEPSGVWRGDHSLPTHEQDITILGTPLGHVDFVQGQLDVKIDEHGVLLNRISKVPRSPVCLALALVVRRFPSKLRAPGCQSCVVFPIRADA